MTPPPPAPVPKKRGLGFWLALGGGAVFSCCLLTAVCGAVAGNSVTPAAGGAPPVTGNAEAPAGVNLGDDVVYRANPNDLGMIAAMNVVGGQVLSGDQLLGAWLDDHRNFGLRLSGGGGYEIHSSQLGGGAAIAFDEEGTWSLAQGQLTLTPSSVHFNGTQWTGSNPVESDSKAGPPRSCRLDGVVLEYQPWGVQPPVTHRIDGLHLVGPAPEWLSNNGPLDVTLRRSRDIR